jgi:hypothetical protein
MSGKASKPARAPVPPVGAIDDEEAQLEAFLFGGAKATPLFSRPHAPEEAEEGDGEEQGQRDNGGRQAPP